MDGIVGFHDAIRKCEYCDGTPVESRIFKCPREMRIFSKNQIVGEIRSEITVFD